MNVDSKLYNEANGGQIRDAVELLDLIKLDGVKRAEIIVDVGCGSGNVTALLADAVEHNEILAIDVDPQMIEFSKDQIKDPSISFLLQDISLPWNDQNSQLKALEGKVDLVWSNRVLHWVDDIEQAAENILRLLKPGGRFYSNITLLVNFNEFLPEEEKLENEIKIKIPSRIQQQEFYKNSFVSAGLKSATMEFFPKFWTLQNDEQFYSCAGGIHILKRYLNKSIPKEKQDEILKNFREIFIMSYSTPIGQQKLNDKVDGTWTDHYGQFRLSGIKL